MSFLLAKRYCNALIESASPDLSLVALGHLLSGTQDTTEATDLVLKGFKKFYGGLWVGGKVTLTTTHLTFIPNVVNRVFNGGDLDVRIDIQNIRSSTVFPGILTKVVAVDCGRGGVVKLRCFNAASFSRAINMSAKARASVEHGSE